MTSSEANQQYHVLITGASKGIGLEIATKLSLSPERYKISGTSRNVRSIPASNRIDGVQYFDLDLTQPTSIDSLFEKIPDVDIIINNAGCSHNGPVEEIPMSRVRNYYELNLFGPIYLVQKYLPHMRAHHFGRIINISSMASLNPVPFSTFYASSKSALNTFSFGLDMEMKRFNVKVTTVAPFEIHTELPQDFQTHPHSIYYSESSRVKETRDSSLSHAPSPKIVANLVDHILTKSNPKPFYPVGKNAHVKYFLVKHLPRRMISKITRKLFHLSQE